MPDTFELDGDYLRELATACDWFADGATTPQALIASLTAERPLQTPARTMFALLNLLVAQFQSTDPDRSPCEKAGRLAELLAKAWTHPRHTRLYADLVNYAGSGGQPGGPDASQLLSRLSSKTAVQIVVGLTEAVLVTASVIADVHGVAPSTVIAAAVAGDSDFRVEVR